MKRQVYEYEDVVLGSTLEAVLYSHNAGYKLVMPSLRPPDPFDQINDLKKLDIWNEVLFDMSLAGEAPMADKVTSVRVEDSELKVVIDNSRMIRIKYENLFVFDDDNTSGLGMAKDDTKSKYRVLDWFEVKSGMKHQHTLLTDDQSDFVSEVHFYNSFRTAPGKNYKDLASVSLMSAEQLKDVEYSDVYVRFKVLDMMKAAGIKGSKNVHTFRPLKIECVKREVFFLGKPKYKDFDRVRFMKVALKSLLNGD